jgi:hypothetical protein
MARWLIRITGKQRREVDIDLIVQAVIALGHQLAEEEKTAANDTEAGVAKTPAVALVADHEEAV